VYRPNPWIACGLLGLMVTSAPVNSSAPDTGPSPSASPDLTKQEEFRILASRTEVLVLVGKFAAALSPAPKALKLAGELHGELHWQTADASLRLSFIEKANSLAPAQQELLLKALRAEREALRLERADHSKEAELSAALARDIYSELLGPGSLECISLPVI
jgi:hypothetical protein